MALKCHATEVINKERKLNAFSLFAVIPIFLYLIQSIKPQKEHHGREISQEMGNRADPGVICFIENDAK